MPNALGLLSTIAAVAARLNTLSGAAHTALLALDFLSPVALLLAGLFLLLTTHRTNRSAAIAYSRREKTHA